MFDLSKMGDMMKLADEAKKIQRDQEKDRRQQTDMLKHISAQLDTIIKLLNNRS